jgi:hypothetical protein
MTVAGHLIWVAAAWLLRQFFAHQPETVCVRCGETSSQRGRYCSECGFDRESDEATILTELSATARQLRGFGRREVIDADTLVRLLDHIALQRRQIIGPERRRHRPKAPTAAPAPNAEMRPEPEAVPETIVEPVQITPAIAPAVPEESVEEFDAIPLEENADVALRGEAAERARAFVEQAHASTAPKAPVERTEAPPAPEPPPPPRPPRRSLAELLAGFMEQRNILWGEVVGGLLIVGCSIALVISLWHTLERIPYFPFLIFAAITASLFGGGLYTLHHWKLESTSRGLLVIATLLVPLMFMVMAGLHRHEPSDWLELVVDGASVAFFGWLVFLAGQVLVPGSGLLLPVAVLGAACSQLLLPWLAGGAPVRGGMLILGAVAIASHATAVGRFLQKTNGSLRVFREPAPTLSLESARDLLNFVAIATFPAASAIVFLMVRARETQHAIESVSVLIAIAGIPLLAAGFAVYRGLATAEDAGVARTAGTIVIFTGIMLLLAAPGLAWGRPEMLVLVSLMDFALFTYVAVQGRLPAAHAAAIPCLALGYLTGFHLLRGDIGGSLNEALLSPNSGVALAGLVAALGLAAEWFRRRQQEGEREAYVLGGAGAALLSLILIAWPPRGLDHPERAALIFALYGAAALVLNIRRQQPLVASVGLSLLLAATLWTLFWRLSGNLNAWGAIIAAEALVPAALSAVLEIRLRRREPAVPSSMSAAYRLPLATTAEGAALLAGMLAVWTALSSGTWTVEAAIAGWALTAVYLLLFAGRPERYLAHFAGVSLSAAATAACAWAVTIGPFATGVHARLPLIVLALAASTVVLAGVAALAPRALRGSEVPGSPNRAKWLEALAASWGEIAIVAGLVGLGLQLRTLRHGGSAFDLPIDSALAIAAFLTACAYSAGWLSWLGSVLLLLGIFQWEYRYGRSSILAGNWPALSLLIHSSLTLVAGRLLRARAVLGSIRDQAVTPVPRSLGERFKDLIGTPLWGSGLVSSLFVVPALVGSPSTAAGVAVCLLWLAAIWLVASRIERIAWLFAASQGALAAGAAAAATWWLTAHGWYQSDHPESWAEPRNLQVYGLALAFICVGWAMCRLALKSSAFGRSVLVPGWPDLIEPLLGLVVLGQYLVAGLTIKQALIHEAWPSLELSSVSTWHLDQIALARGPACWLLFATLLAALIVRLLERRTVVPVLGLSLLAITLPVLGSSAFMQQQAAGLAARWGWAICFVICSMFLWFRGRLAELAARWSFTPEYPLRGDMLVRGLRAILIVGCVLPCLASAVHVGFAEAVGAGPIHPASGSLFGRVAFLMANALALLILSVALAGHALRERSGGYALAAGSVLNGALTGWYFLGFLGAHPSLTGDALQELAVRLLELGSMIAALWGIVWLRARARLSPGRLTNEVVPVYFGLQTAETTTLFGFLVGGALLCLVLFPGMTVWTRETGSPLGGIALLATAILAVIARMEHRLDREIEIWIPIAAAPPILAACFIERLIPSSLWGYRTLMLGCSLCAMAVAAVDWLPGRKDRSPVVNALSSYGNAAAVLAFALGLRAAISLEDRLWAAAAIGVASAAAVAIAARRGDEARSFSSGLGLNVAVSFAVWHFHASPAVPISEWWIVLLQANIIASAVVALLWLAVRGPLSTLFRREATGSHFLPMQANGPVIASLATLAPAVFLLVFQPELPLPLELEPAAGVWGWLAFAIAMSAAAWYAGAIRPRMLFSCVCVLGLGLGALAAVLVARTNMADWWPYHVLVTGWTLTALAAVVTLDMTARRSAAGTVSVRRFTLEQTWILGIGGAVCFLALRGADADPSRPYYSATAVLALSGLAGFLWSFFHDETYAYLSGLLLNVAAFALWAAWASLALASFIESQIVTLALGSIVWTSVALAFRRSEEPPGSRTYPYRHAAVLASLLFLGVLAAWHVGMSTAGLQSFAPGVLGWSALGVTLAALLVSLWDRTAERSWLGLYVLGPIALAFAVRSAEVGVHSAPPTWTIGLAVHALAAAAIGWAWPRSGALLQRLRLERPPTASNDHWFVPLQALLAYSVLTLGGWIVLHDVTATRRLIAPLTAMILVPSGALMAARLIREAPLSGRLRYGTLVIGAVAAVFLAWAMLDPVSNAILLERNAGLMIALAGVTVLYGIGLTRSLGQASPWGYAARRLGPILGGLTLFSLVAVLGHEAWLYDPVSRHTPLGPVQIGLVAAAFVGMIAATLAFAVMPGRDPFRLSERGRVVYVYTAEALLALLLAHLRLNVPELFAGWAVRYWPFLVMAVAFAGVGLSEFLGRRGLDVLAGPLNRTGVFLPLLPLLAFWAHPQALQTGDFREYATLWFTVSALYAVLALARQSFRFALLTAISANVGLWSLLYHEGLALAHPQMWLVPGAIIILASEHLNRDRLKPHQSLALRYLALITIYVSSTADMFIAGLGRSWQMPLLLAILSVAGILAGMVLRVRAFLFVGTAFLLLVVTTMIWHAGVDQRQTWILWSAGIVLGAAILALFGLFEKRRNDVLRLVEELREWR